MSLIHILLTISYHGILGAISGPSYEICPNRTVTVLPGDTGWIYSDHIVHKCILTLDGFKNGSYVAVRMPQTTRDCNSVRLNGVTGCIRKHCVRYAKLDGTELVVHVDDYGPFRMLYVNNVPWCESPDEIKHATYQLSRNKLTATYRCNEGFKYGESANMTSICSPPGRGKITWTWSDVQLICKKVSYCASPPTIEHATYWLSGDYRYVVYQCDGGYYSSGTAEVTSICRASEHDRSNWTWSSIRLICKAVPWCIQLPLSMKHAMYQLTGDYLTATYYCDKGYKSNEIGVVKSICQSPDPDNDSWRWSFVLLTCNIHTTSKVYTEGRQFLVKVIVIAAVFITLLSALICGITYYIYNKKKTIASTSYTLQKQSNGKSTRTVTGKKKPKITRISKRSKEGLAKVASHSSSIDAEIQGECAKYAKLLKSTNGTTIIHRLSTPYDDSIAESTYYGLKVKSALTSNTLEEKHITVAS